VASLYISCLRKGCFHKVWKSVRIIPLTKPGKENCKDKFKYLPIRVINAGRKIHWKLLINRIMHFLYNNNLLNQNQFGFTTHKSTSVKRQA
jgi:hypothetical protein